LHCIDFDDAFDERRIGVIASRGVASDRHPSIHSQHSVARGAPVRARHQARIALNAE